MGHLASANHLEAAPLPLVQVNRRNLLVQNVNTAKRVKSIGGRLARNTLKKRFVRIKRDKL